MAYAYDRFSRFCESHKTIKALKERIKEAPYTIEYDNFIDNDSYGFMVRHSQGDAFLRKMESLNWMLRNPFVHEAPLTGRENDTILFSSSKEWQRYYVVKVYVRNEMAGVYVLCNSSTKLTLLQFYYELPHQEEVLLSLAEHILKIGNVRFSTTNSVVADFVNENGLYAISDTVPTSICYPEEYESVRTLSIQGGDGDMFLN